MDLAVLAVLEYHEEFAGLGVVDDLLHTDHIGMIDLLEYRNLLADPITISAAVGET